MLMFMCEQALTHLLGTCPTPFGTSDYLSTLGLVQVMSVRAKRLVKGSQTLSVESLGVMTLICAVSVRTWLGFYFGIFLIIYL